MAKILIVDDDKIILKVLEATLSSAGYTVVAATDGHDALSALNKESFSLVISDANMPGAISGFDLARTIRAEKKWAQMGIMLLTGRRKKTDVVLALKCGVEEYLIKPIDSVLLLGKVEALLEKCTGALSFTETKTSVPGSWPLEITVVGVSEQSISFIAPLSLPTNSIFKINSPLFDEINIDPPTLRLISSKLLEGPQGHIYVSASFVGLTSLELKALRIWVRSNNLSNRKSA